MIPCLLAGILFLASWQAQAQIPVLIGMKKEEVVQLMQQKFPQFVQNTDFKNSKFKYLKFVDKIGDETLLVFLSDDDVCTVTKLMTGYDNESTRIGELNKQYKKINSNRWEINENGKSCIAELRKEEWYLTIIIKPKS